MAEKSDQIKVLPYTTIQPSSLQVEMDVASSGAAEDYWISIYKTGHSSVHGRVHCRLAEGEGLIREPRGIKVQPDGTNGRDWLATASELGVNQLRLRRPTSAPETWHPKGVEAFDFIPLAQDSAAFVSGSINGSLRIGTVSLSTGQPSTTFEPRGHLSDLTSAQFFPSGDKVILTTSLDSTARLWNAQSGSNPRTLSGHTRAVTSAALIPPHGQRVLTTSLDSTLRQWDLSTGEELSRLDLGVGAPANKVILHPSDPNIAFVALRTSKGAVVQVDVQANQIVKRLEDTHASVNAIAVSQDGTRLLAGDQSGLCTLWDLSSSQVLQQWRRNDGAVLTISPTGTPDEWLVGGADGLPYRVRAADEVDVLEEFGCATEEEAEKIVNIVEKDGVVGVAGGKTVVFYTQ